MMKPRKRINPISDRQKGRLKEYAKVKREWWKGVRRTWCPVALNVFGRHILVNDLHHTRGRCGSLLCDTRYWLAVSRFGHIWIENHPEEARNHGFLCKKGDWNRP